MSIKIFVRQSNGEQFEVDIDGKSVVNDLKKLCEAKSGMKAEEMRLIFKGKILKDEVALEEYKITDGLTVHLVKGKVSAPQPTTDVAASSTASVDQSSTGAPSGGPNAQPFPAMGGMGGMGNPYAGMGGGGMGANPYAAMQGMGGMGGGQGGMPPNMNPQMMQQMMSNPMVQQMMQDPETMRQIINSNPMLSQMAEQNPQIRQMLDNPQMMQQMMNPQAMQNAMSMMQNMQSQGGGAMPGQSFGGPGAGGATGATGASSSGASGASGPGMNPYGGMGGMQMDPAMMAQMQQMMGGPGMGGGGAPADTRPSREKYAEQLAQIKEMGFNDEDAILQILEQTGGNVQLALEKLFQ